MGDLRCDRAECGHLVACAACFQAGLRSEGAAAERRRLIADVRAYAADLSSRLGRLNGAVIALREWADSTEENGDHAKEGG